MGTEIDRNKTILIIEDEADLRVFASRLLKLEGYAVIAAADGEDGLTRLRENEVDLVLLDLRLPGRDGWSVLSEIKRDRRLGSTPVIIFSASVASPQYRKAYAMGATDYLTKPLSAAMLRRRISRALNHPKAFRESSRRI